MKKTPLSILVPLSILLLAAPSFAEISRGDNLATGFVGGQVFDLGNGLQNAGANFTPEVGLGGRIQHNFTNTFGIEGNFNYSPGRSELFPTPPSATKTNVNAFYYAGNAVYTFMPARRWNVFATGGFGGVSLQVQNASTDTFPAFNYGGGVTYDVTTRVRVRGDVRNYWYTVNNMSPDSLQALNLPDNFDKTVNDLSWTFGGSFRF
jgi:opacity protein-like surface antigen